MTDNDAPKKDESQAHPIAMSWRPMIKAVVSAFVNNDFELSSGLASVTPIPREVSDHNRNYVKEYGATLVELSDEAWKRSCAQWMGAHWDLIVDLCTKEEGVSDLGLTGKMEEVAGDYQFTIGLIYVP